MSSRFQSQGGLDAQTAHDRSYAIIERIIEAQSATIAFEKAYFALAVLFIVTLPLLFLFKNVKGKPSAEAH